MIWVLARHRLTVVVAVAALWSLVGPVPEAAATPGWGNGEYLWYKPGTAATHGTLTAYVNGNVVWTMTAGSGWGERFNDPCLPSEGRLPDGWYNGYHEYHIHNKDTLIKGRVWGITDKTVTGCEEGEEGTVTRTALYIHTEESSTNQPSPAGCLTDGDDDPYCWENAGDYESAGCLKVSYPTAGFPNSVNTLNSWWHTSAGGATSTYYAKWLYVGATAPAKPPLGAQE